MCVQAQLLSHVQLYVTPGTAVCQAPLCMGFPRQENWSGWLFPSPGDLPDPGIKPTSPALAGRFLPLSCSSIFLQALDVRTFQKR